jgi:hypothetical protein
MSSVSSVSVKSLATEKPVIQKNLSLKCKEDNLQGKSPLVPSNQTSHSSLAHRGISTVCHETNPFLTSKESVSSRESGISSGSSISGTHFPFHKEGPKAVSQEQVVFGTPSSCDQKTGNNCLKGLGKPRKDKRRSDGDDCDEELIEEYDELPFDQSIICNQSSPLVGSECNNRYKLSHEVSELDQNHDDTLEEKEICVDAGHLNRDCGIPSHSAKNSLSGKLSEKLFSGRRTLHSSVSSGFPSQSSQKASSVIPTTSSTLSQMTGKMTERAKSNVAVSTTLAPQSHTSSSSTSSVTSSSGSSFSPKQIREELKKMKEFLLANHIGSS